MFALKIRTFKIILLIAWCVHRHLHYVQNASEHECCGRSLLTIWLYWGIHNLLVVTDWWGPDENKSAQKTSLWLQMNSGVWNWLHAICYCLVVVTTRCLQIHLQIYCVEDWNKMQPISVIVNNIWERDQCSNVKNYSLIYLTNIPL